VRSGLLELRQGSIAGRKLRSGVCPAHQRIQRFAVAAVEIIGLAVRLKRVWKAGRASVPAEVIAAWHFGEHSIGDTTRHKPHRLFAAAAGNLDCGKSVPKLCCSNSQDVKNPSKHVAANNDQSEQTPQQRN